MPKCPIRKLRTLCHRRNEKRKARVCDAGGRRIVMELGMTHDLVICW